MLGNSLFPSAILYANQSVEFHDVQLDPALTETVNPNWHRYIPIPASIQLSGEVNYLAANDVKSQKRADLICEDPLVPTYLLAALPFLSRLPLRCRLG